MDGGIILGILGVAALSVSSALMLRLLLHSPVVINWFADDGLPWLRRHLGRQVEQPVGRPIEEIARSIRRLGAAYYGGAPGRSNFGQTYFLSSRPTPWFTNCSV